MAYADQKAGNGRIVALVIVALIHAVIGYAFVTGLAYKYVKEVQEELETFEVDEPPPPPEEEPPPPPPEEVSAVPPPVVTPPPIVRTNTPPPVVVQSVRTPPAVYVPIPVAAPPAPPVAAPVAPPAPKINKAAGAKGNPADWITTDDYPASALRSEDEGTSAISWTINTSGRVENCRVTSSSGSSALDDAACRAITRRGRYTPAQDQNGRPISSTQSRRVVWRIPQ